MELNERTDSVVADDGDSNSDRRRTIKPVIFLKKLSVAILRWSGRRDLLIYSLRSV